jgi:hypothetical protein
MKWDRNNVMDGGIYLVVFFDYGDIVERYDTDQIDQQ